jgi:hypothetical protein
MEVYVLYGLQNVCANLRRVVFEQCAGENVGTVKEKEKMV